MRDLDDADHLYTLPRRRRPRNPRSTRALLLAAGLCLVAWAVIGGTGSGRASATEENVREVPPMVGFMSGQVEQSVDGGTTWATPHATVSAPGAGSFSFQATGSASVVKVIEGSVAVAAKDGAPRVNVTAGQALAAGPDGLQPATPLNIGAEQAAWQPLLEQAGLSVTTTTLAGTTTTRPLPPDGPAPAAWPAIGVLTLFGWVALAILGILGTFVYLGVNRHNRHQKPGR